MVVDPRCIRGDSPVDVVAALCGCERYQLECWGDPGPYTTRLVGVEDSDVAGLGRAMFESRGPNLWPMYASAIIPIESPREAYETLATRGLIPLAAVEDPTRRFTDPKVPHYCKCGSGNGFNCMDDLSGTPVSHTCTACGFVYWHGRSLLHPTSIADVVAFASLRWNAIIRAESLARETVARLRSYGVNLTEHVTWVVEPVQHSWAAAFKPAESAWSKYRIPRGLDSFPQPPNGIQNVTYRPIAEWIVKHWPTVLGTPCPLAPWLDLDDLGGGFDLQGDEIILTCSPITSAQAASPTSGTRESS